MLDVSAEARRSARPPADRRSISRQHLAALEAQGLLVRVDRPINKDTELHPLVRWQFQGGLAGGPAPRVPVHQRGRRRRPPLRHAGRGRRARGLAAHLCARHGAAGRGDRGRLDARHRAIRSRRSRVPSPPCQEVVITGDELRGPGRGLARAAGADLDAGLRRRALSHRDALRHARSRDRHPEHGHLSRRAQSDRPARRAHGRRASAAPAATCTGRSTTSAARRCRARS